MKHLKDENAQATAVAEAPSAATADDAELEARLAALDEAEKAIEGAFATGKVDSAAITKIAQDSMEQAIAYAKTAIESDELADEATRLTYITASLNDKDARKQARAKERDARRKAKADHRAATKSARTAYNAIKFSETNRMGLMRVIQIVWAIHIIGTLFALIMSSRDTIVYNSTGILDWIMVILEGIGFWLLINRYSVARPYGIAAMAFNIIADLAIGFATGNFNIYTHLWYSLFSIAILLYLAFSTRVQMVCVNDITMRKGEYDGGQFEIQRSGWPFVRNNIMYFIIFSVLGHWMEAAMCQLIIAGLVEGEYDPTNTMLWRDWLYPFPMEGAAVVLIALLLYPFLQWMLKKFKNPIPAYLISFVANALLCSAIEFSMGLIFNAEYQLWDYRENFGNIMGQVCLQNALAFGAAASIITWFVYPLLEKLIARVPRNIMNLVFVGVLVFGGMLWSLYIIEPPEWLQSAVESAASLGSWMPVMLAGARATPVP